MDMSKSVMEQSIYELRVERVNYGSGQATGNNGCKKENVREWCSGNQVNMKTYYMLVRAVLLIHKTMHLNIC